MKLKRLEIIGFKSFMDKTVVTFDRNIIGVVGPNGCGKSNIVDAIRWVMGEMSAKHLRGNLMEDVIFAGSSKRPPTSMASVELTFSTDGYQTPAVYLDHAEISICRRLYRTGESEYYINKVPVRLRDITDLFLGTGIGKKAYSVIEQGRVSEIITAKPEDRRYYIEEVAGISKFKSRKDAALRKMEATQANLARLNDVVTEIERQMNSLDRQAKKATRYKSLRDEFQKWDLGLSANRYQRMNILQEGLETELASLDHDETESRTLLHEQEAAIETQRLQSLEEEKRIQSLQNSAFELTNSIRLAEAKIGHRREEQKSRDTQNETLSLEFSEQAQTMQGLNNGLNQINEQYLHSHFEIEEFQQKVSAMETESQSGLARLHGLTSAIDGLKKNISSRETRLTEIKTLKQSIVEKRHETLARRENHQTELNAVEENLLMATRIFGEAKHDLEELQQIKLNLNTKTDDLVLQLKTQQGNLAVQSAELEQLGEELQGRQSRLNSLEELHKNFEGYHQGTRSVLLNRNRFSTDSILGTVADQIETEPEFEGAVSAVLGEKLEYIIVKSQTEGAEAVDFLRQSVTGRSSFIPMSLRSVSHAGLMAPDRELGLRGSLNKFVRLKNGNPQLAEFLFGDVVLCDTLQQALQAWSAQPDGQSFVTLSGEVVDPAGVITGGSMENTNKVLLEQKREMAELTVLISKLKIDWQSCRGKQETLSQLVGELKNHIELIKNTEVQEAINIAHHEKDISHVQKEMETARARQRELADKITAEENSLTTMNEAMDGLSLEEQELLHTLTVEKQKLDRDSQFLEEIGQTHRASGEKLTTRKIQLAQALERHQHLSAELLRLQNEIISLRWQGAKTQAKLLELNFHKHTVDGEIRHTEKVLDKKLDKKTGVDAQLTGFKQIYEAGLARINLTEAQLKTLRQNLAIVSDHLKQKAIKLTEIRGQLKHLIEQSFERHQINLPLAYANFIIKNLDEIEAEINVNDMKDKLAKLGPVNTEALEEYETLKTRYDFLKTQQEDLTQSLQALDRVIHKINRTTKERFGTTFDLVNARFQVLFKKLFRGGQARLVLTDENNLLETGVDIIAQPPGKKLQSINLLSGGEKALAAVSLIFAIFQIKPSPFCILDEVDAPLDDANVNRYNEMLREMTNKTQFILITHNKTTMELGDTLYGVTMPEPGVSQLVSVQMN